MSDILAERFESCSKTIGNTRQTMPPAPSIPLDGLVDDLVQSGFSAEDATSFLETLAPLMWHFVNLGFEGDILEILLPGEDSAAVDSVCSQSTELRNTNRKGPPSA